MGPPFDVGEYVEGSGLGYRFRLCHLVFLVLFRARQSLDGLVELVLDVGERIRTHAVFLPVLPRIERFSLCRGSLVRDEPCEVEESQCYTRYSSML